MLHRLINSSDSERTDSCVCVCLFVFVWSLLVYEKDKFSILEGERVIIINKVRFESTHFLRDNLKELMYQVKIIFL